MQVKKNGILQAAGIHECQGMNILNGTYANQTNPWIFGGTSNDIILVTNNVARITPGKVYYLVAKCDIGWAPAHLADAAFGKGTIWLYCCKKYDESNSEYDAAVCFTSTNWVKEGVWKVTVTDDFTMARVRLNTYSDGSKKVTAKFWDIALIPEEYYTGLGSSKLFGDKCISNEIVEV